jgi:hypothetical protein
MKQDTDRPTPSSNCGRNSLPAINPGNLLYPIPSSTPGSPNIGDSFRQQGDTPPAPMTREKFHAVLQKALDIIEDDSDDSDDTDFDSGLAGYKQ